MNSEIRAIIFLCGLAVILWFSRHALRHPRSHGFYRFFAWVAILTVIVLNFDVWFRDPFSVLQLISWFCLLLAGLMVALGTYSLYVHGRPSRERDDPTLFDIEKTTELVTTGLYRYIRHPLYSSLFYFTWGAFFKNASVWAGLMAMVATVFLYFTSRMEEAENIAYFGDAYRRYMQRTKMFVPYLF